jgi:hypothetical protein
MALLRGPPVTLEAGLNYGHYVNKTAPRRPAAACQNKRYLVLETAF